VIIEGLGVRVELTSENTDLAEAAWQRLPVDWKKSPAPSEISSEIDIAVDFSRSRLGGGWRLTLDGRRIAAAVDSEDLLAAFEHHLPIAVASRTDRGVALHAALVSWQGKGVLLPGVSFSGKSTLVAALVDAGARFEADDLVLVEGSGAARGIPRALVLRENRGRTRRSPASLGWQPRLHPLPVERVLFLRFDPAGRLAWEPLTPATAALFLFAHAIDTKRDPARLLTALSALVSGSRTVQGLRGEAPSAARRILDEWTVP
jgi:hypothetical protein